MLIAALKRLYLMAHAPAEPQMWFRPAMPGPAPEHPKQPADLTDDEKHELSGWREDYLGAEDMKQPRVRDFAERSGAYRAAEREWSAAYRKATLIQWPRAWADAVIESRA